MITPEEPHPYRYALQPLKARGIAVLRIDHAGKDAERGQRGSSAKNDDVDTVWSLMAHGEKGYELRCTHQRSGNHPPVIQLTKEEDPLRFEVVSSNVDPKVDAIIQELDRIGLPQDAGRDRCLRELKMRGFKPRQLDLKAAIRQRKINIGLVKTRDQANTCSEQLEINNGWSEDQHPKGIEPGSDLVDQVATRPTSSARTQGPGTWSDSPGSRSDQASATRPGLDFPSHVLDPVETAAVDLLVRNGLNVRVLQPVKLKKVPNTGLKSCCENRQPLRLKCRKCPLAHIHVEDNEP